MLPIEIKSCGLRPTAVLLIAALASAAWVSSAHATIWITGDMGGTILEYAERFQKARDAGEQVVIDGKCLSACTMVIGMVPRGRVCATSRAVLGFHAAFRRTSNGSTVASTDATKFMLNAYPAEVRHWINAHGGLTNQMIYLQGRELAAYVPSCQTSSSLFGTH